MCPIPDGVAGTLVVDQNDVWSKGLKAYGETPSDVLGKRVDIPSYPQFLSLMVDGEANLKSLEQHRGYEFVSGFLAEFRKQVPYRKDVLFNAKIIYENVKERTNCSSCTMVSVHLRLGDYTKMMQEQNFPAIVSETNYLSNAFNYIIENYLVSAG